MPSCNQRRNEPAHKGTNKPAPRHAHARVKTGRAVIGARKECWGLSRPRAGGGSGRSGIGVCGRRTRAAERRRTWTRISGGYCFGIAFGRDRSSISAGSSSSSRVGGFNFWAPFPDAIFMRALRTVAMLIGFGRGRAATDGVWNGSPGRPIILCLYVLLTSHCLLNHVYQ